MNHSAPEGFSVLHALWFTLWLFRQNLGLAQDIVRGVQLLTIVAVVAFVSVVAAMNLAGYVTVLSVKGDSTHCLCAFRLFGLELNWLLNPRVVDRFFGLTDDVLELRSLMTFSAPAEEALTIFIGESTDIALMCLGNSTP